MSSPSVTVDRDRCIGAGNCEFRAPGTFRVGDDGVSEVVNPAGDPIEDIRSAAYECPMSAIEVDGE